LQDPVERRPRAGVFRTSVFIADNDGRMVRVRRRSDAKTPGERGAPRVCRWA